MRRIAILSVVCTAVLASTVATAAALPAHTPQVATRYAPATVTPVQVTGDPAERFTMVILGDGYTAAQRSDFYADVERNLDTLWSIEPYRTYRSYFDVYAVAIDSPVSGISCDPLLSSPRRDTPLGTALWSGCRDDGIQRLLVVGKPDAAEHYADLATPDHDQVLVLANSDTYGGAGGTLATATGGNALSALISPHELGHSLGGLQDEYDYYQRGVPGGAYTGSEPDSVHLTTLTIAQMKQQHRKWWRWLGVPSAAGGTIGRFEGGDYSTSGIWRPSRHSIMKSLGYQYDQVERERMTQRISEQTELIARSTPAGSVTRDQAVWVETPYPVYHQLDVTWSVNGSPVAGTDEDRTLELSDLGVHDGDTVTVTVRDPTAFVRDPDVRATLTATRSWTVRGDAARVPVATSGFSGSTSTDQPVNGSQLVYAYPPHPVDHEAVVTWRIDGAVARDGDGNDTAFDLATQSLTTGSHTLSATLRSGDQLEWSIDQQPARTSAQLSTPLLSFGTHHVYAGRFTMKLTATDDRDGYVEREFRLDHDGWTNYYGWPTDASAPFRFTPRGTNVDDLIYGNLGSGGMSLSPFVPRTPGYGGVHTVEYRGVDAAGNIAPEREFSATVLPAAPACTRTISGPHRGNVVATDGTICLDDATVHGSVTVRDGASLVATSSTITGGLVTSHARYIRLVDGSVGGNVQLAGTTGSLSVLGTRVDGAVAVTDSSTAFAPTIAGAEVAGSLVCLRNSTTPSNIRVPDRVTGPSGGQCAGL